MESGGSVLNFVSMPPCLIPGGCKKSCVYGEIIFPDMSQICRNLLSNITTFMLSNFFSDDSIANLLHPIHVF